MRRQWCGRRVERRHGSAAVRRNVMARGAALAPTNRVRAHGAAGRMMRASDVVEARVGSENRGPGARTECRKRRGGVEEGVGNITVR